MRGRFLFFIDEPSPAACWRLQADLGNVENNNKSLFEALVPDAAAELASALAPRAAKGHFDELRGQTTASLRIEAQGQPQCPKAERSGLPRNGSLAEQAPASVRQADTESAGLPAAESNAVLAKPWTQFFNFLGIKGFDDLDHRTANLRRQIRDNGVTYNVYADSDGPQRPWSLDLFPLIVSPEDWAQIDAGIRQRARLLNHIMADVYGPQDLLTKGLLPAALVQGHPGYLRAMQGVTPAGGIFLHIAAFDLAHGSDGRWWVVSQRTQAPSGLGYLLENRLACSMLFPEAFREMQVQRLASSYKTLVDGMKALSQGAGSRIVLLTPGPYNETYFEHAYLARYLGLTLVEGGDLLVRDEKLYLKTLQGLEPVDGLLKRLDDEFLDPLELRSDSTLGVPGLLQAIRAGNVMVANMPGSAFLESSALLGFLPALSRHFLGEALSLPSLATWWCGEQAAMQEVVPQLKDCVIKSTYPGSGMEPLIGRTLSPRALDEWAGRILRQGEAYTVQAYLPLSQTPTWQGERIAPRSAMLRVFAVPDRAGGWQVLPGGLARLAGKSENIASMQHGGSSADVWVLGDAALKGENLQEPAVERSLRGQFPEPDGAAWLAGEPGVKRPITSRAAENLFWLGRYTERAENAVRMAQLTLHSLGGEDQSSQPLLAWLTATAVGNALVPGNVAPANRARRVFERSLIAGLAQTSQPASVGFNLRAIKRAASAVRERLSQEQWHVILRAEADFFSRCEALSLAGQTGRGKLDGQEMEYSSVEALRALESASGFLAAMTGAQTDRMMRDDGWRLLSIGRHVERLSTLSEALLQGFSTGGVFSEGGFTAIVAFFDSTITFNAHYQQRRDVPALLDLVVLDLDNPRSLGWVVQTLRARIEKLTAGTQEYPADLAADLPEPGSWTMAALRDASADLAEPDRYALLMQHLRQCSAAALKLSDLISRRYFSHAAPDNHSFGA
jgi:uncharacterized circularly permuted ATP-grasp superfamily protein/uncharacterized alpha-E superfamily protein